MGTEASWALVECPQGRILRESMEALSAALSLQKQYGLPAVALWTGARIEETQIRNLSSLGVRRLVCLEETGSADVHGESLLDNLKGLYLRELPRYFFFGASPLSLSLAPRLSALLEVGYAPRVTYLRRLGQTFSLTRPLVQGRLSELLHFRSPGRGLISLHPRSFDLPRPMPAPPGEQLVPERLDLRPPEGGRLSEVIESKIEPPENLELEDAEIVVAGGKGMGSRAGFELLHEFAGVLGGAVGATRIAVDLGWAPKERLVGQSGKKVAPELYVCCGISGAHQHRTGMKDSRYILAINTDPQAPIFQVATWGVIGDAPLVVHEMLRLLRKPGEPHVCCSS